MIELTYEDINEPKFVEAFNVLLEKDIDVGDAVEVARSLEVINRELNNFKKVRDELIKRHGVEVKEGEKITGWTMVGATKDNVAEFEPKYLTLMATKFDITLESKVMLEKKDGKMKPIHAYALRKIIDFKK